ncbi:hypothetical protein ACFPOI_57240 [Nonomuraea angiospora]|jgi:FXSXX-COOH protein|uniref:FXSXX-COOH protein n=2 Tax=Nonomuraea TaxID=83681 RepID=A0A7W9GKJ9_9ACTN|nr:MULTISPECIES: hypothetical protein [Nonomuraea]MBB5785393.1 FXSXX-COOH protein [Nonomuraea jabiensis]MBE1586283.1 FXSXX-COOH protein [Nonomuraea angiospora]MDX3104205.1 hypothetical protein [Nonomuraea angiospora]
MNKEAVQGYGGGLIDVSGRTLEELKDIDDSRLKDAIDRLLDETGVTPVAKFQSSI